jgi:hypothetical protein
LIIFNSAFVAARPAALFGCGWKMAPSGIVSLAAFGILLNAVFFAAGAGPPDRGGGLVGRVRLLV